MSEETKTWSVERDSAGNWGVVSGTADNYNPLVATMWPSFNTEEYARLIAAAPELLEALKLAVEEVEELRKYANNHGGMIDDERCDYARSAIAKATSQPPKGEGVGT